MGVGDQSGPSISLISQICEQGPCADLKYVTKISCGCYFKGYKHLEFTKSSILDRLPIGIKKDDSHKRRLTNAENK